MSKNNDDHSSNVSQGETENKNENPQTNQTEHNNQNQSSLPKDEKNFDHSTGDANQEQIQVNPYQEPMETIETQINPANDSVDSSSNTIIHDKNNDNSSSDEQQMSLNDNEKQSKDTNSDNVHSSENNQPTHSEHPNTLDHNLLPPQTNNHQTNVEQTNQTMDIDQTDPSAIPVLTDVNIEDIALWEENPLKTSLSTSDTSSGGVKHCAETGQNLDPSSNGRIKDDPVGEVSPEGGPVEGDPSEGVPEGGDLPDDDQRTIKSWLDLRFHDNHKSQVKKPDEIEEDMPEPLDSVDEKILDRIQGSMIGMALGDALGAHVEFRPHNYLVANPVTDLEGGGTWGLQKGQFTDDTSMALCLANSLVVCRGYVPYDQLVRYKWWYKHGYMSSTGQCFDIGHATRQSIVEFERRQKKFAKEENVTVEKADYLSRRATSDRFDEYCSEEDVAGNGALMRLTPVPLFFYRYPEEAVEFSGQSGQITHGDVKAYDACRFYGALIVAALQDYTKDELLDKNFYSKHRKWFGATELHPDIKSIAEGSYKEKKNYAGGIRGKGYIVDALEAAIWAFWSDEDSFEKGALAAVNLGDDTDTTAAIYGQLAGAYYGYQNLPKDWLKHVYAHLFLKKLSKWIVYEGQRWEKTEEMSVNEQL